MKLLRELLASWWPYACAAASVAVFLTCAVIYIMSVAR